CLRGALGQIGERRVLKVILFGEPSLRRALSEYVDHYHRERNHQGKGNVLLFPRNRDLDRERRVQCPERLGGNPALLSSGGRMKRRSVVFLTKRGRPHWPAGHASTSRRRCSPHAPTSPRPTPHRAIRRVVQGLARKETRTRTMRHCGQARIVGAAR